MERERRGYGRTVTSQRLDGEDQLREESSSDDMLARSRAP